VVWAMVWDSGGEERRFWSIGVMEISSRRMVLM
jgi:hypothetical protein